ncbi:MAG: hypothetical protein IPN90_10795 [Elusimicrobia bacterium]|nr:hypothetical protein [Elusimicrobiota bacterium]
MGVFGAMIFILCCNALPFGHYVDDIKWVLLAESFLSGSVQTAWSIAPLPDTTITWGFGLLLTPVVQLFGRQALVLKIFSALCVVGGCVLFYMSIRRMLDIGGRILFLVGMGGVSFMVGFSGNVISEAGYLLLFGVFAFMISRLGLDPLRPRSFLLMGSVAGALFLVRNIGVLGAIALIAFWRRFFFRRDGVLFAAGFFVVAAPVSVLINWLSGTWSFYGSYWALGSSGTLLSGAGRFLENLYYYWKGLTCLTLLNLPAILPPILWVKLACMVLGLFVLGRGLWFWWAHPAGRWLCFYFLGYMIVLGLWTYQAPRYAFPVYPVFLAFFGAGMSGVWAKKWGRMLILAMGVGVLVTNGSEIMGLARRSFSLHPVLPHESERWLADHSRPEEIVVSMDIARVFYFTGRRGVPFIPSSDVPSFEAEARRLGATVFFFKENQYVPPAFGVVDPIARQHEILRAFLFGSKSFEPVYTNSVERTTIFRFKGSSPVV